MALKTNLILKVTLTMCVFFYEYIAYGQSPEDTLPSIRVRDINEIRFQRNDTVWITSGICKTLKVQRLTGQVLTQNTKTRNCDKVPLFNVTGEAGFQYMKRTGNADQLVLLNTRSGIANLQLAIVYKDNLPFRFGMRYNFASPFQLDNPWEINIGFDNLANRELVAKKIKDKYVKVYEQRRAQLQNEYNRSLAQYQKQKEILESPEYIQQAVEARFRQSAPISASTESLNLPVNVPFSSSMASDLKSQAEAYRDSLRNTTEITDLNLHEQLEKRKDSLHRRVIALQDSLEGKKRELQAELDSVNQTMAGIYSQDSLDKYIRDKGVGSKRTGDRAERILRHSDLRLGKFLVYNSELTISGIYLHGAGLKLGGDRFIQLIAGSYDFAFREMFLFQQDSSQRHRPFATALRLGKTDGKNLRAVNFYWGQKRSAGNTDLHSITGISYERKFFISRSLKFDFELAKSNTRKTGTAEKDISPVKDLLSTFNPRVFGGYGNAEAHIAKTNTDLNLTYRYWGLQFDAFNGGMYYNPQHNISARASQQFWKRKFTVNAGFRHSDFRTFGVASNLNSKTNFLSLNTTLRIRKFPVLNLGYYPGSQLYKLGDNNFYEYYYNILNATASHYFHLRKLPVQTVLTWNQFENRYSDSIFSGPSSAVNFYVTTWVRKLSLQASYSWQKASFQRLSTWEGGVTYGGAFLRVGGSAKWNHSATDRGRAGYSFNISYMRSKIGTISLLADQSYLPDGLGAFIPVKTGQIQFIKPIKFRIWQKGD